MTTRRRSAEPHFSKPLSPNRWAGTALEAEGCLGRKRAAIAASRRSGDLGCEPARFCVCVSCLRNAPRLIHPRGRAEGQSGPGGRE